MKPLYSPTADEFYQVREQHSMSQSSLAALLGVHTNTVKNIEAGRTRCSPQLWYFTQARLVERNEEIKRKIEEHVRRWPSKVYRGEWRRKAKARYGN